MVARKDFAAFVRFEDIDDVFKLRVAAFEAQGGVFGKEDAVHSR